MNTNKILFIATFLSKLAFTLLFAAGTFLIHTHIVENDLLLSCGGNKTYFRVKHSHCYINGDNERCDPIWYDYNGVNITEPWDEKVVQCMYNVRGGLFTAAAVFFVFSIILEDPRVKTMNEKLHLLMTMLHALGGLFLFGSVVSEMDIMKRVSSSSIFWTFGDYKYSFVIDYPDISNVLWIIGTLITTLCYLYMGYLYMRDSIMAMYTYIVAAVGSFFLFVAGTIRNRTVAEKIFPNPGYATFYIDSRIFGLMLTGTVLFFVHSFMYYFTFYDYASVDSDNNELNAILSNDEESNPNASNNNEQDKDEVKQRLVNHENEA